MTEDLDVIGSLERNREQLEQRIHALDVAIAALRGDGAQPAISSRRAPQVGDDKLDAVKVYLKKVRRARQADIVRATGFNSGTVSQALQALAISGDVKPSGKEDRSRVWEAATTK